MSGYLLTAAISALALALISQSYLYDAFSTCEEKHKNLGIEPGACDSMRKAFAMTNVQAHRENSASQRETISMPYLDPANDIMKGRVTRQDYHPEPQEQNLKLVQQFEEVGKPLSDPAKKSNYLQSKNMTQELKMQINNNQNRTIDDPFYKEWAQSFCTPYCE
jgi:hypothetical protein